MKINEWPVVVQVYSIIKYKGDKSEQSVYIIIIWQKSLFCRNKRNKEMNIWMEVSKHQGIIFCHKRCHSRATDVPLNNAMRHNDD